MNQRTLIERLLSPAGFGFVLLLFLFPFLTASCEVKADDPPGTLTQTLSFTGADLVVGGSPDITVTDDRPGSVGRSVYGGKDDEAMAVFDQRYGRYYPPQPLVIGAAVIIFAGMAMALLLPLTRRGWPTAAAALLAAILLAVEAFLVAPGRSDDAFADALKDVAGAPEAIASGAVTTGASPALGLWLALAVLVALGAWQAHVAFHGMARSESPVEAEQPAAMTPPRNGPVGGVPEGGATPG